jgi:hypothetical protein
MPSALPPSKSQLMNANELEAAVDRAIAASRGDLRSTIRGLIVTNDCLETEVCDLMQTVSHAFVRGRLKVYMG